MRVGDLAVSLRTGVVVFAVLALVGGIASYAVIPKESQPSIEIPYISITTVWPGATPDDLVDLVTRPLERAVQGIEGIEEIRSTSRAGVSTIIIEFTPEISTDDASQHVRQQVAPIEAQLPDDAATPFIREFDVSQFPVLTINLAADYPLWELRQVAEDLREELQGVAGVLDVEVTGGLIRQVQVDVDKVALEAYGLTFDRIVQTILQENVTTPGGSIDVGRERFAVRIDGRIDAPRALEGLVVSPPADSATPVYLRNVADVIYGFEERDSFARVKVLGRQGDEFILRDPPVAPDVLYQVPDPAWEPTVSLAIQKRTGENVLETVRRVTAAVATFPVPDGTRLYLTGDSSEVVDELITSLQNNIVSGVLMITLVLVIFFPVRTALVIGGVIPMTLALTFLAFGLSGVTLNFVMLFSLIIALGLLVDFAIVVVENIDRARDGGASGWEAVRRAVAEIDTAVVAATLTTIAAFVPLLFWGGEIGRFMRFLPITLITTLLAALVAGLVIAPVVTGLASPPRPDGRQGGDDSKQAAIDDAAADPQRGRLTRTGRRTAIALLVAGAAVLGLWRWQVVLVLAGVALGLWAIHRIALRPVGGWFRARVLPAAIDRYGRFLDRCFDRDYSVKGAPWRNVTALGALAVGAVLALTGATVRMGASAAGWVLLAPGLILLAVGLVGAVVHTLEVVLLGRRMSVGVGVAIMGVALPFAIVHVASGELDILMASLLLAPGVLLVVGGMVGRVTSGDRRHLIATDNRVKVVCTALGAVIVVAGLTTMLSPGQAFFPETDPNQISITIDAPSGTTVAGSNRLVQQVQARLDRLMADDEAVRQNVKDLLVRVGVAGGGQRSFASDEPRPERSRVTINFVDYAMRAESSRETRGKVREALEGFTGATTSITSTQQGPPTGPAVNIEISGPDFGTVASLAEDVRDHIRQEEEAGTLDGLADLETSLSQGGPEDPIRIDRERAARVGLSTAQIARVVRAAIDGTAAGTFQAGEDDYDIVVRLRPEDRQDLDSLQSLEIPTADGGIPLVAVAALDTVAGTGAVTRLDLQPLVTVTARSAPGHTDGDVLAATRQALDGFGTPAGYSIAFTGQTEEQQQSFRFLGLALGGGLGLIALVLVITFNSVLTPVTILAAVSLTLTGALLGTVLTQIPVTLMVFLGTITLAGIVVDDDIVLHEFADGEMRKGRDERRAYVAAGRIRFRQVVLTALTTIAGLLPLTLGITVDWGRLLTGLDPALQVGNESAQFWGPMGTAVIAGLPVGVLVSLCVTLPLHSLLESARRATVGALYRRSPAPAD